MYDVIALIGESGSGKDTILKRLVEDDSTFHEIVSCTSRQPREKEIDGVNYHFLSTEEFANKILAGDMLEYTIFNNWFYGTSLDSLDKSKINVGVFNPAGIASLLKNDQINLMVYHIEASPKVRMMRQLLREQSPNVDEIIRRYTADKKDFESLTFERVPLRNETYEDLQACVEEILAAV